MSFSLTKITNDFKEYMMNLPPSEREVVDKALLEYKNYAYHVLNKESGKYHNEWRHAREKEQQLDELRFEQLRNGTDRCMVLLKLYEGPRSKGAWEN